jgi:hypothetical protein
MRFRAYIFSVMMLSKCPSRAVMSNSATERNKNCVIRYDVDNLNNILLKFQLITLTNKQFRTIY